MRNISYDTTQDDFKNFFATFGPLKYALLCKSSQDSEAHKGTGFVSFRDPFSADKLIELSKQIESRLDVECKEQRLKDKKAGTKDTTAAKGVTSVIQAELELNGRRLVVMEAVGKGEENSNKGDDKKKQDKRNLALKREGLLNYEDWVHKQPRPTEKMIATRQRLLDEKDKALTKSTNLFVSKKRIQMRGLPRKDFFEAELKELMMVVIEEWIKKNNPHVDSSVTTKSQKKKYLKQVKILRDENKVDQVGEKLPSGLGFAEFEDEGLALFAIRYLNNMELVPNKGLIADYSLEDARVIHKREQRFERLKKVNLEKKKEAKKEQKSETKTPAIPAVVELGKPKNGEKPKVISIDQITD